MMRSTLPGLALFLVPFACNLMVPSPAARSPLKEKLAPMSQGEIETLARTCLEHAGWKPDSFAQPFAGGGSIRLRSTKKGEDDNAVYIAPTGQVPRVTGGPQHGDTFWECLEKGGAAVSEEGDGGSDGGAD